MQACDLFNLLERATVHLHLHNLLLHQRQAGEEMLQALLGLPLVRFGRGMDGNLIGPNLLIAIVCPQLPPAVNAYIPQQCTAVGLGCDKAFQLLPLFSQFHIKVLHGILRLKSVAKHPVCLAIEHLLQRHEPLFEFVVCHLLMLFVVASHP